jgi:hypothetical protein
MLGAPIFPDIYEHRFLISGAAGTYDYNGSGPDILLIPADASPGYGGGEVFIYTPPPVEGSPQIIWDLSEPIANLGGDLYLDLAFSESDGPFVPPVGQPMDVSLIGTGNNSDADPLGGADLKIWGTLKDVNDPNQSMLFAMEVLTACLYGYADGTTYTVEAIGQIVASDIDALAVKIAVADAEGETVLGALKLSVTFPEVPTLDPGLNLAGDPLSLTSFSGETGLPEPVTLLALAFGGAAIFLRRRRR